MVFKVCVHAALSNGVFDKDEKEMIGTYCREMNVKEQEFMKSLIKGLHVPEQVLSKFEELLEKYSKIGKELYDAIIV